jgi:solute carrier family 36 (proton-coupled amino acid transporter)
MAERGRFRGVLFRALDRRNHSRALGCFFGACGYLAYGDATRDIITLNLPRTSGPRRRCACRWRSRSP